MVYSSLDKSEKIAKKSILVFIFTGFAEFLLGTISGSVALISDSIHTFTDALVSAITFFGLKFSRRLPDGKFHFGYYKVEAFSAGISALVMIAVGLAIVYIAYLKLLNPAPLTVYIPTMIVAILAAVIFWVMGFIKIRTSRIVSSNAFKFDTYNTLKSGFSSLTAFFGVFLSYLGFHQFDALAGIIIGGFIFTIAYITTKEVSLILLDACRHPEFFGKIKEIAKSVRGVVDVYDVRLRSVGLFVMGEITIKVDGKMSVEDLNKITKEIREKIKSQIANIVRITIQAEIA